MIKNFKIFIVTIGIILITSAIFCCLYLFSAPEPGAKKERFVINLKVSELETVEKLYSEGYIKNPMVFKAVLTLRGWRGKIKPGGYLISKSMNNLEIADILVNRPYQKWVVIPEGLRKEEIAENLSQRLDWEGSQKDGFLLAAKEGYLFPDTYLLNLEDTGQEVAKRLFDRFNEAFQEPTQELLKQNIRSDTAIKIASLIQREAANEKEMPLISGIIWNRLLKPMPLEIDASLQYALGKTENWWPVVKKEDYKIDSPYNTYLYKSHPPTPICNPGLTAIWAVIYPEETDYFYYLHDKNKQIHCAKTYKEHLENIKNYILIPAVETFVKNYLDTYSEIEKKENYDEVKNFLTEEQLKYIEENKISFEQDFIRFDNYEISNIAESKNNPEADYIVQVKLYYKGEFVKNPKNSEITEIYVVRENNDFKTPTWHFVP